MFLRGSMGEIIWMRVLKIDSENFFPDKMETAME